MSVWPLFGLAGLLFAEVLGVRGVGDVRGCCKRVFRAKGSFLSQNHLVCADPFFSLSFTSVLRSILFFFFSTASLAICLLYTLHRLCCLGTDIHSRQGQPLHISRTEQTHATVGTPDEVSSEIRWENQGCIRVPKV